MGFFAPLADELVRHVHVRGDTRKRSCSRAIIASRFSITRRPSSTRAIIVSPTSRPGRLRSAAGTTPYFSLSIDECVMCFHFVTRQTKGYHG